MKSAFVQDAEKRKKDTQVVRIVKDVMTKQISFLFLLTGYEKCFWKKELQIKMSSLLNVSNGSKSEEFNLKDIGVRIDNKEQNWFKRAHIG